MTTDPEERSGVIEVRPMSIIFSKIILGLLGLFVVAILWVNGVHIRTMTDVFMVFFVLSIVGLPGVMVASMFRDGARLEGDKLEISGLFGKPVTRDLADLEKVVFHTGRGTYCTMRLSFKGRKKVSFNNVQVGFWAMARAVRSTGEARQIRMRYGLLNLGKSFWLHEDTEGWSSLI